LQNDLKDLPARAPVFNERITVAITGSTHTIKALAVAAATFSLIQIAGSRYFLIKKIILKKKQEYTLIAVLSVL
jgi:hypothetical protein